MTTDCFTINGLVMTLLVVASINNVFIEHSVNGTIKLWHRRAVRIMGGGTEAAFRFAERRFTMAFPLPAHVAILKRVSKPSILGDSTKRSTW